MPKVKVNVLRPFGPFQVGEAEVEVSRLPYLVSKGIVESYDGEPVPEDEQDVIVASLQRVATGLSIEYGNSDTVSDFVQRLADLVEAKEIANVRKPTFEEFMKEYIPDSVVEEIIRNGYDTPEKILEAVPETLEDINGVGTKTAEKLPLIAKKYRAEVQPEGE